MIVFTYIWQVVMVLLFATCTVLAVWAGSSGEGIYAFIFSLNAGTFAIYFSIAFMWRATERLH